MPDQNNIQIKPKFSKGDIVKYIGKVNYDCNSPMIVLEVIIEKNQGVDYCLLDGDRKVYLWERHLALVQ